MLLVVYGPTGVGKTDFVERLAEKESIDMINMDMGQLYTPLSIGTAKPELDRLTMPYHLFDLIDKPTYPTVHVYRALIKKLIPTIEGTGNVPVLVGGSSFYLRSLFFPVGEQKLSQVALPEKELWWHELEKIDPQRSQEINPQDYYRLKRALTIWYATGKKPSEVKPVFDPIVKQCIVVGLMRNREELYARINQRVEEMIAAGWIDEVKQLDPEWHSFLTEKKIIGYDIIVEYLKNPYPKEELIERIAQKTRNYAKKQLSFWRSFSKVFVNSAAQYDDLSYTSMTINLSSTDETTCMKELQSAINHMRGRND